MKNTFGNSISVTIFGESHGPAIGVVLDGLAPGIDVNEDVMADHLSKRRPSSDLDTARREEDHFQILSGVFHGKTTGTPLAIVIPNEDTRSKDYTYGPARPSHADYAAFCKYHGFEDYRGGGHFSGRLTAALVAAGGILIPALEKKGIRIETHIDSCGGVQEGDFDEQIRKAAAENDSVGGITKTTITGLPRGLGEPWIDSVESQLSHILFSVGGVKGVEFGSGFALANMKGSEANDPLRINDAGEVYTETNHNGGINGGITNGMPVVFRCAIKPTASIAQDQKTIDFQKQENIDFCVKGRHDPAIVRRACPVIDSVTAIVAADLLAARYGTDYLAE